MHRCGILLALFLALPAAFAAEVNDDEAWIERHMAQPGQAAAPAQTQPGYRVARKDLRRFVGRSAKFATVKGGSHRGLIERVDGNQLFLRSRAYGGYAEIMLRVDQIVSAELE